MNKRKALFLFVWTCCALLGYYVAYPWVVMGSEKLIVAQMNNSDANTAVAQYFGHAESTLFWGFIALWIVGCAVITAGKSKKDSLK